MPQPLIIFWNPVADAIKSALTDIFGSIVDTVLKQVAKVLSETLSSVIEHIYSGFLRIDTPGVGGADSVPTEQAGQFITVASWTTSHLLWLSAAVATMSIAIAGGKMLWGYAHGYHENLKSTLSGLTIMVIVNLLVIQGVRIALWIGDRYTEWILDQAQYKSTNPLADAESVGGSVLMLLMIGGLVLLSMLVQMILMVFRSAILVVLAGTIILPAAAATTDTGRKWLNKYIAWMLAFICMKPAAATVYAVAFKLINPDEKGHNPGFGAAIAGMVLLGAAVFVMPALLRLLTPVGMMIGGAMTGGDTSSPSSPQQQPDGSSEPASPRGSDTSSSGGGGGGLESGPSGASSAEGAAGASRAATSAGGMGSGGGTAAASGGGTAAATESASVAAAPETMGASLPVGAAVGAAEAGKQAFEQAVTQGAEEAGSADGSSGPVGGTGGGVDLG